MKIYFSELCYFSATIHLPISEISRWTQNNICIFISAKTAWNHEMPSEKIIYRNDPLGSCVASAYWLLNKGTDRDTSKWLPSAWPSVYLVLILCHQSHCLYCVYKEQSLWSISEIQLDSTKETKDEIVACQRLSSLPFTSSSVEFDLLHLFYHDLLERLRKIKPYMCARFWEMREGVYQSRRSRDVRQKMSSQRAMCHGSQHYLHGCL